MPSTGRPATWTVPSEAGSRPETSESVEIVVASDASSDRTNQLVADVAAHTVTFYDIQVTQTQFPTASAADQKALDTLIRSAVRTTPQKMPLDVVLRHLEDSVVPSGAQGLATTPPVIFYSSDPAILVNIDGEPVNPRLHVAMHQVVANQLLANNPPEIQFFAIHFGYNFYMFGHAWKRNGFIYHVDGGVLISPDDEAVFEIHVGDWFGSTHHDEALPIGPEMQASKVPLVCVHGTDESDSFCLKTQPEHVKVVTLPGGHHYNGDYAALGNLIVKNLPARP